MGGRGASYGKTSQTEQETTVYSGWTYDGYRDRLTQLEDALDKARSLNKINTVAIRTKEFISNLDKEIQNPEGNVARLKAYKYRANKLFEKAKKRYSE